MSNEDLDLIECRFKCLQCGDIVEPKDSMTYCQCGKLGVDSEAADVGVLRIQGNKDFYRSLCVWKTPAGKLIYDEHALH